MRLYSLGSNGNCQLSLGHGRDTSTPTLCQIPGELERSGINDWQIECGGNHTLLITEGRLYASGSNEHNQLGLEHTLSLPSLARIHDHIEWIMATCGFDFTILVSSSNELYSMGRNDKGALALDRLTRTSTLQRINFDMRNRHVLSIKASLNHVVMLLSDYTCYGWGSTRKGALGPDHDHTCLTRPTILQLFPQNEVPRHLGVGKDWTFVVTDVNCHYAGPKSRWNVENVQEDIHVDAVKSISCNWSSAHFLTQDGRVLSSGRHDRGQFPPIDLPALELLVSGSEHSAGLGRDSKVYVWGWNEHGNCGSGTADVTYVKALEMPHDSKVVGCAAGYGTTFVWCHS